MKINAAAIVAILCITILMVVALVNNIDGRLLALAITIISGLGGFVLGKGRKTKNPS